MEGFKKTIWERLKNGIFIIAEVGKNFIETKKDQPVEVYLKNAKRLVDEAARAGADAVKFQTHFVEDEQLDCQIVSPHFNAIDRYRWVKRNTEATPLDAFWKPLKAYCKNRGIIFFSTPMSRGAAKILDELGVELWKVGSGDILDFVLLDYLRESNKPVILSSGMSTFDEVKAATEFLQIRHSRLALLHCVSQYPCPPEDLRLGTISFYKDHFAMPIGFSDHSLSIESALVAAALGATIIEKHFSLSRDLWGADHKVSLNPQEFAALVSNIRQIQSDADRREMVLSTDFAKHSLQYKNKEMQEKEAIFRPIFRKCLMAGCDIPSGTVIVPEMLYAMRPLQYAGGISSEQYVSVVGRKIKKN